MNQKLILSLGKIFFQFSNSGSTCSSLIFTPQKVICANVGDSRIVLGLKKNESIFFSFEILDWEAVQLTRDHKPSEEDENLRIHLNGGNVKAFQGK